MSNTAGFQIAITCWVGNDEAVVVMDNVPVSATAELLKQWARPKFLRKGSGLVALNDDGDEVFVKWRDVIDMRAQPQVEVIK